MARLGRAQPFRPILRLWNYTQTQVSQVSMAGVGALTLMGSSLGAGIFSAAGTSTSSFTATTPAGSTFLRKAMINQTVNRSAVY